VRASTIGAVEPCYSIRIARRFIRLTLCLGAQFEAMSFDWLNLGLQDPRITGSNDPISGANDPRTSWFDLPLKSGGTIRLRGLPQFVSTRGGAYTFLPSLSAIGFLGSL
jgi:hypothetical protein